MSDETGEDYRTSFAKLLRPGDPPSGATFIHAPKPLTEDDIRRVMREELQAFFGNGRQGNPVMVNATETGRLGGIARGKNMTPEQRKEAARKAAQARWGTKKKRGTA